MRISVVITNYNYAAYLAEAIDSALNQSHPAHDVVVVDDGSTDNSRSIIESYGDRVLPVYKQNGGQSSSFHAGFSACEGDAVIFLDADDVLFPDAIQKHAERMQLDGVVKSNGYMQVINTCGEVTGGRVPSTLQPSGDYLSRYLSVGPTAYRPAFTSGNCWSRQFLQKVLPLPDVCAVNADALLTSVDLLFGRIESIEAPVCWYRVHSDNKGPKRYRFERTYLEDRLQMFQRRITFSSEWAARMNYTVNPERWLKACGWKMTLASLALKHMGSPGHAPSPFDLFVAAFRNSRRISLKSLTLAPVLGIAGLLPKKPALKLAAYLLGRTWGRGSSADFGKRYPHAAGPPGTSPVQQRF